MSLDVEQLSPSAPKSAGRLTDRERLLCAHLALVRYLTRGQLWRLAYPGRSESVVSHRLKVLVSLGFLRHTRASGEPLEFRALDGRPVEVWALTLDGYRMALSVLGELPKVPTQDVGAPYLQHATGLVEFYLSMVGAGPERLGSKNRRGTRSAPTSPANLPPAPLPNGWAWVAGEMVRFPIAKKVKGIAPERLYLQPDSIIEWPGKRSRMFVEWETGTNPIVSQKSAALLSKFNRYEEFFRGLAEFNEGRTWYAQAFPDGWPASVLVVLHSERRKQNVASALRAWCQQDPTRTERHPFRLVTVPEAQQLLSRAIAQPHAAQVSSAAPRTEAEERLRPGRVAVRGEQLLALERYLSAFLHDGGGQTYGGATPARVLRVALSGEDASRLRRARTGRARDARHPGGTVMMNEAGLSPRCKRWRRVAARGRARPVKPSTSPLEVRSLPGTGGERCRRVAARGHARPGKPWMGLQGPVVCLTSPQPATASRKRAQSRRRITGLLRALTQT